MKPEDLLIYSQQTDHIKKIEHENKELKNEIKSINDDRELYKMLLEEIKQEKEQLSNKLIETEKNIIDPSKIKKFD